MFKTFWERWWITNRLYHFARLRGHVWVDEDNFLTYLTGEHQSFGTSIAVKGNGFFLDWLKPKRVTDFAIRTRNLIQECSNAEEGAPTITRSDGTKPAVHIRLSYEGRSSYSVTYLIFRKVLGNAYVKGILLAGLTFATAYYVKGILGIQE